jgi:hypothetical protein
VNSGYNRLYDWEQIGSKTSFRDPRHVVTLIVDRTLLYVLVPVLDVDYSVDGAGGRGINFRIRVTGKLTSSELLQHERPIAPGNYTDKQISLALSGLRVMAAVWHAGEATTQTRPTWSSLLLRRHRPTQSQILRHILSAQSSGSRSHMPAASTAYRVRSHDFTRKHEDSILDTKRNH